MKLLFNLVILIFNSLILCNGLGEAASRSRVLEDPLFLTPYINSGQLELARELALVRNLEQPLESYSGFITINETFNSNTFFWFFPAANNASTAPVVLWCEGGPGVSGLYSLFNENGPYRVDENGVLHLREQSWHLTNSMIFMDNPIGSGFSFTEQEEGYPTSSIDASNIHNFLTQFFTLFPSYRQNDFYSTGVSFGGIFAPTLAHHIHTVNREGGFHINLKGLLVESGWSNPIGQVDYGDFLYHIGFLDETDRDYAMQQSELIKTGILEERFDEAYAVLENLAFSGTSFVLNRTGLGHEAIYNFISLGKEEVAQEYYIPFVEQEQIRNAIHVGNRTFLPVNSLVNSRYTDKGLKSVTPLLEELLDAPEGYRILYYSGQLDVITYHRGVKSVVDGLEWSGAEGFRSAKPEPWRVGPDVAGWVKNSGNLTFVLMRNAGHDANTNQPVWGFDVMTRFIRNIPFV